MGELVMPERIYRWINERLLRIMILYLWIQPVPVALTLGAIYGYSRKSEIGSVIRWSLTAGLGWMGGLMCLVLLVWAISVLILGWKFFGGLAISGGIIFGGLRAFNSSGGTVYFWSKYFLPFYIGASVSAYYSNKERVASGSKWSDAIIVVLKTKGWMILALTLLFGLLYDPHYSGLE